jgi:hypothetical protein
MIQYHRSYNFKGKIHRGRCTIATHSNDSDRYVVRVQTFAMSCATRFCNDYQQSTWTSLQVFGLNLEIHASLMDNCMGLLTRWKKPSDLCVYTNKSEGKTKNIVYSKALQETQLKRNNEFQLN